MNPSANEPQALKAALWYAKVKGWTVLPCHSPTKKDGVLCCSCGHKAGKEEGDCHSVGKHPIIKFKDFSKDEATIRSWFEKWPEASVGIATGLASGVWVLDIDPKSEGDETLRELEKKHGRLPFTPYAITGSGGAHYFFRLPVDVAIGNRAGIAQGIDVRGDGGFVVAAPSVHASGRNYEWELDSRPEAVNPAEAPGWLLDLVLGRFAHIPGSSGAPASQKKKAAPLPAQMKEGGRDNLMASFAGSMRRRGASEESILAALRVENSSRCDPPLGESDLLRISKSIASNDPEAPFDGNLANVPLEDRSTIGIQILRELPAKTPDQLLQALEDRSTISALVAVRKLEPGVYAAGLERVKPTSLRKKFESVVKASGRRNKEKAPREPEIDDRPEIDLAVGDLEEHVQLAAEALAKELTPPGSRALYLRSGKLSRVRTELGSASIELMREKAMIETLSYAIRWVSKRTTPEGALDVVPEYPPKEVAGSLIERPNMDFPKLASLYCHPVFVSRGSASAVPLLDGYDAETGALVFSSKIDGRDLPGTATPEEARAAARWMLEEVFVDFPFDGPAELATAFALAFAPFIRPLIDGNTPLHLIEASSQGSGKGLLTDAALFFATGGEGVAICTQAETEDEWRKSITAKLCEGSEAIVIDNATGHIDSAALSAVLTMRIWADRRLGRNDATIRVPVEAIWAITANNLSLSRDLTRRVVRCRLVPMSEEPYKLENRKFKHKSLIPWMKENRKEMLRKAWTAVAGWITAGAPKQYETALATYEPWSYAIGGLLKFLDIPGFLENRDAVFEAADRDAAPAKEFVKLWFSAYREQLVTTDQLLPFASRTELGIRGNDDSSRKRSLSWLLRTNRDRIYRGWKIIQDPSSSKDDQGRVFWKLVPVTPEAIKERDTAPAQSAGTLGFEDDKNDF